MFTTNSLADKLNKTLKIMTGDENIEKLSTNGTLGSIFAWIVYFSSIGKFSIASVHVNVDIPKWTDNVMLQYSYPLIASVKLSQN